MSDQTKIQLSEKDATFDLISRQAAIDAVHKAIFKFFDIVEDDTESPMTYQDKRLLELNKSITQKIKSVPSAQPEPLTDKEQRIFLAAMGREEKVCKQVDDECRDCMEPYEDSLVRTCHEIMRKVKSALWT